MNIKNLIKLALIAALVITAYASVKTYPAQVSACFTPYQNCTHQLVQHINKAKQSIYMQGYSFTSGPIGRALVRAHKRGVNVQAILDKSNFDCSHFSYVSYLIRNHIPVWNDYAPNIAHNKVMIFDKSIVETGSFNFTKSAQYYNTENVMFINSKAIAKQYVNNWYHRMKVSKRVKTDPCKKRYYRKNY